MRTLFICMGILLSSCTEMIEVQTNDTDPVLVVYGSVTTETSYQTIELSRSAPYFKSDSNLQISDAKVTIESTDGKQVWKLKELARKKGVYQTERKVAGIVGLTYNLRIAYDFNNDGADEMYNASTTIKEPFRIDSLQINSMRVLGRHYYTINLFAQEPLGPDYYVSRFYINGGLATVMITWLMAFDDKLIDGKYLNGLLVYTFSDQNNQGEYDPNKVLFVQSGDTVAVEIDRVEKGYYDFITQCKSSVNGENPFFGGPPSNIVTNLTNGAVGYFAGYAPSRKSVIVP